MATATIITYTKADESATGVSYIPNGSVQTVNTTGDLKTDLVAAGACLNSDELVSSGFDNDSFVIYRNDEPFKAVNLS